MWPFLHVCECGLSRRYPTPLPSASPAPTSPTVPPSHAPTQFSFTPTVAPSPAPTLRPTPEPSATRRTHTCGAIVLAPKTEPGGGAALGSCGLTWFEASTWLGQQVPEQGDLVEAFPPDGSGELTCLTIDASGGYQGASKVIVILKSARNLCSSSTIEAHAITCRMLFTLNILWTVWGR